MVNDYSDSEWGNPLPPHGLLFQWVHHEGSIWHQTSHITLAYFSPSHPSDQLGSKPEETVTTHILNMLQDSTYYNLCYTFYWWLNIVGHMVNDHWDCERKNLPHNYMGYSFQIIARGLLYIYNNIKYKPQNACWFSGPKENIKIQSVTQASLNLLHL